jgi:L-2,4-diaminobutyric acid acetyltransferase
MTDDKRNSYKNTFCHFKLINDIFNIVLVSVGYVETLPRAVDIRGGALNVKPLLENELYPIKQDVMSDEKRREADGTPIIRRPNPEEGAAVHDLVAACPPLDRNSLYFNLIQCTHFRGTCAIALTGDRVDGLVSGHIPPEKPDTLFVWQVAIAESGRGKGLAKALILDILKRPECAGVRYIDTTITDDNAASWAMFKGLARKLDADTTREVMFDKERHFDGRHDSEFLFRIGPFDVSGVS